jgi:hypothetical protein
METHIFEKTYKVNSTLATRNIAKEPKVVFIALLPGGAKVAPVGLEPVFVPSDDPLTEGNTQKESDPLFSAGIRLSGTSANTEATSCTFSGVAGRPPTQIDCTEKIVLSGGELANTFPTYKK